MWRTIGKAPLIMNSVRSRRKSCLEPRMEMKDSEVSKGPTVHLKERKKEKKGGGLHTAERDS